LTKSNKIPQVVKQIQKHNLREINYAFEKTISYSQTAMFLSCPHKWSLQYKEGHYISEASISATFGTALHETIQHYLTIMYAVSAAEADRLNLEEYFEERFKETYLKDYKSNKNTHFSDPSEMREFFEDGLAILNFIKKKRSAYFSRKGWYLVGCELPLLINPNPEYKNVFFKGYLDVVLYHEPTNSFRIIDIKTSRNGWDEKTKKDEIKQLQLVSYKKLFSHQFNVPEDNIEILYFIVKRKVWEESPYPISRIQEFTPASGKIKLSKAIKTIDNFINEVFNLDGSYKNKEYKPNPSEWNCRYCPFRNKKELCSSGMSS
jgi:hypothetical protein